MIGQTNREKNRDYNLICMNKIILYIFKNKVVFNLLTLIWFRKSLSSIFWPCQLNVIKEIRKYILKIDNKIREFKLFKKMNNCLENVYSSIFVGQTKMLIYVFSATLKSIRVLPITPETPRMNHFALIKNRCLGLRIKQAMKWCKLM